MGGLLQVDEKPVPEATIPAWDSSAGFLGFLASASGRRDSSAGFSGIPPGIPRDSYKR